jgi:excisionase family DNA binding protein
MHKTYGSVPEVLTELPITITLDRAVQMFSVSKRTLYRWIDHPKIATVKPGRRQLIVTQSLVDYLNSTRGH